MTYNRSLQGLFVTGKGTSLLLLLMSVALSVTGFLLAPSKGELSLGDYVLPLGSAVLFSVAFLCYIPAAFILGSIQMFEWRTNWLPALFVWLVALTVPLHGDILAALSTLLVLIAVALLLSCQPGALLERPVYTVFAIIGFSAFLLPQFLFLFLPFMFGLVIGNVFSIKCAMAALLGLVTPFWFIYGIEYIYPGSVAFFLPFDSVADLPLVLSLALPTPERIAVLVMELMILLPFIVLFVSTRIPAKPILRRRILFVIVLDIYLMLLSWGYEDNFWIFYVWRLPALAVMVSYVFTAKQNKVMNIYFVFMNLVWISIAVLGLCLR